jgi:hypothetical protein
MYLDSFWRYYNFQVFRFNCFEFAFSNVNLRFCVQQTFYYFSNVFVILGPGIKINKYIIKICYIIFIEYIL